MEPQKKMRFGEGLMLIRMIIHLIGGEDLSSPDLFLRLSQRKLWEEVVKFLNTFTQTHSVVTGSPGIGKTRSIAYLLLLLFKEKKFIIFECRSKNIAFAFTPQNDGSYKVWECDDFKANCCRILENPDYFYIVDLSKGSEKVLLFYAHTIVTASPRIMTGVKDFLARDGTKVFVMPVWKKEEVLAICPYIKINYNTISTDEALSRFNIFGGRLQYIYALILTRHLNNLVTSLSSFSVEELKHMIESPYTIQVSNINPEIGPSMIFVYDEKQSTADYKYEMTPTNYTL